MNCNDTFFGVIIGVMVLELRSAFLRCDLLNCTKHAEGEFGAIKEKEEFMFLAYQLENATSMCMQ